MPPKRLKASSSKTARVTRAKARTKAKSAAKKARKPHRFHPGGKESRRISRAQAPKHQAHSQIPFGTMRNLIKLAGSRLVAKNEIPDSKSDFGLSKTAVLNIRRATQTYMENVILATKSITLGSGRSRIQRRDIANTMALVSHNLGDETFRASIGNRAAGAASKDENRSGGAKGAKPDYSLFRVATITRLKRLAGAKQVSKQAVTLLQMIGLAFVTEVTRRSLFITAYLKVKRIGGTTTNSVLRDLGLTTYHSDSHVTSRPTV